MKKTKLLFAILSTSLLLASCSKRGNKLRTLTTKDVFFAEVAKLGDYRNHPYTWATVKATERVGSKEKTYTSDYSWNGDYWDFEYSTFGSRNPNTPNESILQNYSGEGSFESVSYYLNPFSMKLVQDGSEITIIWNDYGLVTLKERKIPSSSYYGTYEVTYSKKTPSGTSSSTSQNGGQPATLSNISQETPVPVPAGSVSKEAFLNSLSDEALPYTKSNVTGLVITKIIETGVELKTDLDADYTYDEENNTWTTQEDTQVRVEDFLFNGMLARNFITSLESNSGQSMTIETGYYIDPLSITADINISGEIFTKEKFLVYYNVYGYPTIVNLVLTSDSMCETQNFEIVYFN